MCRRKAAFRWSIQFTERDLMLLWVVCVVFPRQQALDLMLRVWVDVGYLLLL